MQLMKTGWHFLFLSRDYQVVQSPNESLHTMDEPTDLGLTKFIVLNVPDHIALIIQNLSFRLQHIGLLKSILISRLNGINMKAKPRSAVTLLILLLLFIDKQSVTAQKIDLNKTLNVLFYPNTLTGGKDTFSLHDTNNRKQSGDSIYQPTHDSDYSFRPMKTFALYKHSAGKLFLSHALSLCFLFSSSKQKTNWEYEFGGDLFKHAGENLKTAWTRGPVWDNDPFVTNYVQHPYAGSFYYNLVRSRGATPGASFGYALIGSTIFEFLTEAFFERPSTQDLIITPVLGSLMGELSHQCTLQLGNNGFTVIEKILVFVINPAYVLNHGFKIPSADRRKQLKQLNNNANVFKPL